MSIKGLFQAISVLVIMVVLASGYAMRSKTILCAQLCGVSMTYEPSAQRGKRLVQELISPLSRQSMEDKVRCCSAGHLHAIADIMAYFDALAEAKGQGFCEGTFVVEDQGGHLFDFLLSHVDTYRRISSHFNEYHVQHYGLDIPIYRRTALLFPRQKRHVLFAKITKDLLFIKPENYGTRLGIPTDFFMHSKEYLQYLGRRLMRVGFERHDWREERIPADIIRAWYNFLRYWVADMPTIVHLWQEATLYGIKGMVAHINAIEQQISSPTLVQEVARMRLESLLVGYDHHHLRKGREVILRTSELLGVTH